MPTLPLYFVRLARFCAVVVCLAGILSLISCGGGSMSGGTGGGSGGGSGGGGGTGGGGSTGFSPPPIYPGNRTVLVRTGDTPSSAVYDSVHKIVFASEPDLGLVDAISVPGAQIVARIPVPGVQALGISADNTQILASTNLQQVAWISTTLLRVTKWQLLPLVVEPGGGPQFWVPFNPESLESNIVLGSIATYAQNPYLLSNGKVLFESTIGAVFPYTVEWDPVANTALVRRDLPMGNAVVANPSGTEVLFAANPCFYDSATDSLRNSIGLLPGILAAANPTSNQFVLSEGPGLIFIDLQFNILGEIAFSTAAPLVQQPTGLVYSPDGTRLYMVSSGPVAMITTIDTTKFSVLGTAPAYSYGSPILATSVENPLVADDTGLVIGSAIGGLVFDDSTDFYSFPVNAQASVASIKPSEGSVSGGTVTTLVTGITTGIPDVWFGSQLATSENTSALPILQATAPSANSAGVVDVKIIQSTGVMITLPQGFTYGSVPLLTAPLASAPGGNVAADIYGFGLSTDAGPTVQQVTIGGGTAKVLAASQFEGFPFQDLNIGIPAGSPGLADIVVKSPTGTATYPKGFRYLTSVTDYTSADTLLAVLYDAPRQQLYLNAGDHIDVFSLTSNTFGSPITPPSLGGTRQLQGLALTPDGSKLIVGNFSDDSVAIIDPDNSLGAKAVQIGSAMGPDAHAQGPHAVATTSKGTVFVVIGTNADLSGGGGLIYELNLTTLTSVQRNDLPAGVQIAGEPISQSADGTKVFLGEPGDSGGNVMIWSASTDSWLGHNLGGLYELFLDDFAASRDGNVFAINNAAEISDFPFPMFVDAQLNQISQLGIEAILAPSNQQGIAVHDSGALLYSATDLGVDIIDVRHGSLAERIVLNEQDAFLSGSLAIDQTGQKIFLLTNAGLTVIDLDAVPLSIGSVTPVSGAVGATVQVRGSGFQAGTTTSFNGTPAIAKFVDVDTLQLTVPTIGSGAAAISLSNPDGTSYRLDAAFSVQ
jgi:hypothetical protein